MTYLKKLRRNTKARKARYDRKNLGKSIEERPQSIENRKEFGYWEFDPVLGSKNADEPAILTMVERMHRYAIWLKVKNHSAAAVSEAIVQLKQIFGAHISDIFKTSTDDNGTEFAELTESEAMGTSVYLKYPFYSWEKGTNECHNKLLRRFIPKRKSISCYSPDDILRFANMINSLPRKILGCHTP